METQRIPGFYWVQLYDRQWVIAEYREDRDHDNASCSWFVSGDSIGRTDEYFHDIDEEQVFMNYMSYYDQKTVSRAGGCLPVVIVMVVTVIVLLVSLFF